MNKLRKICILSITSGVLAISAVAPASAASVKPQADVSSTVCTLIGVTSGGVGLADNVLGKIAARGAGWVGIAAAVGCYAYDEIIDIPPEESRAALEASYNEYNAKSDLEKLSGLGLHCTEVQAPPPGDGTDEAELQRVVTGDHIPYVGSQTIDLNGKKYSCGNIQD